VGGGRLLGTEMDFESRGGKVAGSMYGKQEGAWAIIASGADWEGRKEAFL